MKTLSIEEFRENVVKKGGHIERCIARRYLTMDKKWARRQGCGQELLAVIPIGDHPVRLCLYCDEADQYPLFQ